MPLSIDLRRRVIGAVDQGMYKSKAAEIFKVSRSVIYNWLKLRIKTQSLAPKVYYQKGHSHKIKDWNQFKIFAEKNKHKTIKEMAIEWKKLTNVKVSETTIQRALEKINYTSKKKAFNYAEAKQEQRKQYLEKIKNIDPDKIVYSDESGIDDNEVPKNGWAPRGERCYAQKNAKRKVRYNIIAALNKN